MPVKKFTTKVELTNTQSVSIPEGASQFATQTVERALSEKALAQLDMMLPPGWERGQATNGESSRNGASHSPSVENDRRCDSCGDYNHCLRMGDRNICWSCIDILFDQAYD